MPSIVNKQKTFIQGLSDFWTIFFKDTQSIETYMEGLQITSAQLYLNLMEAVLGTSLEHLPIFNKNYFRGVTIREDKMRYVEGPSSNEDLFSFQLDEKITNINTLINKIILPTNVLQKTADYVIEDQKLKFYKAPFSNFIDFATRLVTILDPAVFVDISNKNWPLVAQGDTLLFRLTTGTLSEAVITGINNNKLSLETTNNNFKVPVAKKDFECFILREPWDSPKLGIEADNYFLDSYNILGITHVASTNNFSLLSSPKWKGSWTPTTVYEKNDFVNSAGSVYVALSDHTSGLVIGPEFELVSNYLLYYADPDDESNNGIYVVNSSGIGILQVINRTAPFSSTVGPSPKLTQIGKIKTLFYSVAPYTNLLNSFIRKGTLKIDGRRSHDVIKNGITYPALQDVIEDIDYTVDYEKGIIYFKSIWTSLKTITATYEWRAVLDHRFFKYKGIWSGGPTYNAGDYVQYNNEYYCAISTNSSVTPSTSPTIWKKFISCFEFDVSRVVKEMAFWGTNVLIDEETLYNNFGYLLANKRESSEQYREFLRGISQLFLLGPTFEKFESALNVVSGFPIIRNEDEILRSYSDGIYFSGNAGQIIDANFGRNGTLTQVGNLFDSATANFFPSDVGAVLRLLVNSVPMEFVITTVNSSTQAVVTPLIPADAINVVWNYEHITLNKRFRDVSGSYFFTEEDLNAIIWMENPSNTRNKGMFRVAAIENANTVILETLYSLIDESNIDWKISRTGKQRVITSRNIYDFDLNIPIRAYVKDPANESFYVFKELEALTDCYEIIDYIKDQNWWHRVNIDKNILQISQNDNEIRRQVSDNLIENIIAPLDQAVVGDVGLAVGFDENLETKIDRIGPAKWFGINTIVLNFPATTELARVKDVGTYLKVTSPPAMVGDYKILAVDTTGTIITLENFNPTLIPPVDIEVKLPSIIFRHTIAFIMFDSFLKYHSLQVKINPVEALGQDLLNEVVDLIKEAKPSFKYIYLEPITNFKDIVNISEDFTVGIGLALVEQLLNVDNTILVGPPTNLQAGDAYRFEVQSNSIPAAPGTYSFIPVLPIGGRFYILKARFDVAVLVNGGTRRPVEGTDYTVNYSNGDVTILPTSSFIGLNTFYFVLAILRTRSLIDPLDPYETRLAVAGADPTKTNSAIGLIDRAVQINIS